MVKRKYILGSEWLYAKIYIGESYADKILVEKIFPISEQFVRKGIIRKYFFIRYYDNYGFHLRVRFNLVHAKDLNILLINMLSIFEPLIENHVVRNICYDTYEREIERYQGLFYEDTESLFYYDSVSILDILSCIPRFHNPDLKWGVCLLLVYDLLDIWLNDTDSKLQFVCKNRDQYRKEFNCISPGCIRNHNEKYRKNRQMIEATMKGEIPNELKIIINKRKQLFLQLYKGHFADDSQKMTYLESIIHMTINRLFASANRACEMVIYEYLFKYMESICARNKVK